MGNIVKNINLLMDCAKEAEEELNRKLEEYLLAEDPDEVSAFTGSSRVPNEALVEPSELCIKHEVTRAGYIRCANIVSTVAVEMDSWIIKTLTGEDEPAFITVPHVNGFVYTADLHTINKGKRPPICKAMRAMAKNLNTHTQFLKVKIYIKTLSVELEQGEWRVVSTLTTKSDY